MNTLEKYCICCGKKVNFRKNITPDCVRYKANGRVKYGSDGKTHSATRLFYKCNECEEKNAKVENEVILKATTLLPEYEIKVEKYDDSSKAGGMWEYEIKKLMKDFLMNKYIHEVIKYAKDNAKGNETDRQMYDLAWRRFNTILMSL